MAGNEPVPRKAKGFSLVEVTLALGIFALAMVSLIGLLVPTLDQAREVRLTHATNEVIGEVGEALRNLDLDNDPNTTAFEEVFVRVAEGPEIFYVFNRMDATVAVTPDSEAVDDVEGFLFAARVSISGTNPQEHTVDSGGFLQLNTNHPDQYEEGYLAVEVALYQLPTPNPGSAFEVPELAEQAFLTRYHTAISR